MKNCLLLISALWLSLAGQAQEQKTREMKPLTVKPAAKTTTATRAASSKPASEDSLAGETIEHCDALIRAIDNKVEYVKSDQTRRENAEQSGWFDKMARNRAIYVARKEALIARQQKESSVPPSKRP